MNDLSCFIRFLPDNRGLIVGGAVYELAADQWVPPRERPRTRRIREPVTGESVLMSRQPSLLTRRSRREMTAKPILKSRPATQQSILRKRIPVQ